MRVVTRGEVTSDLEHFKEVLLEFRDEMGSTIADDTIGKAMMPTYFTHDNFSGVRRSGEYLPNHPDDSLESTEDTAPAFDLFVLLGHQFVGGSRRRGYK